MRRLLATLLLAGAVASAAVAAPRTFHIEPGAAHNQVTFHSEATVESFDGKTRQVSGQLSVDPEALAGSSSAWFQVDLKSLDTGMSLRNKHMRENQPQFAMNTNRSLSPLRSYVIFNHSFFLFSDGWLWG